MTIPWITDGKPQQQSPSPDVTDLYKSTNVRANGQFVVLYAAPTSSSGAAAADTAAINADAEFASLDSTPEQVAGFENAMVASGQWTQTDVDAGRAARSVTSGIDPTIPGPISGKPVDVSRFHAMTSFPDSLVLTSAGTTLGTIRNGLAGAYQIVDHSGLSAASIVGNMANTAQNIWEPVKKQFPNAAITSSFRSDSHTQHGTGQAIDIQFHGLPASGYLDNAKWIRDHLPFDQLLLECRTNGALWIHCSYFSGTGICVHNRAQGNWVGYMINDGGFTSGLRDLSGVSGVRAVPLA